MRAPGSSRPITSISPTADGDHEPADLADVERPGPVDDPRLGRVLVDPVVGAHVVVLTGRSCGRDGIGGWGPHGKRRTEAVERGGRLRHQQKGRPKRVAPGDAVEVDAAGADRAAVLGPGDQGATEVIGGAVEQAGPSAPESARCEWDRALHGAGHRRLLGSSYISRLGGDLSGVKIYLERRIEACTVCLLIDASTNANLVETSTTVTAHRRRLRLREVTTPRVHRFS